MLRRCSVFLLDNGHGSLWNWLRLLPKGALRSPGLRWEYVAAITVGLAEQRAEEDLGSGVWQWCRCGPWARMVLCQRLSSMEQGRTFAGTCPLAIGTPRNFVNVALCHGTIWVVQELSACHRLVVVQNFRRAPVTIVGPRRG